MSDTTLTNPFRAQLDIRHMLSTSPPPQDHVLPGLLAGTVGMLAGPGGVGKTMFELQVALAVACGGSICGGLFDGHASDVRLSRQPGRVVMVAAEESAELVWNRLHAVVATLFQHKRLLGVDAQPAELMDMWARNLHIYPLAGVPRVMLLDRDFERTLSFRQLAQACEGARLVVLDPIRQFHICDENDSGATTALVQTLQSLAFHTKAAVVFAHHTNRASSQLGQGDKAGAARGSTALTDGVRWQLNLSQPTKDSAKLLGVGLSELNRFVLVDIAKANYLPPQPTQVLERAEGGVLVLAQHIALGKPTARSSCRTAGARLP